jgi:hypothetical protein
MTRNTLLITLAMLMLAPTVAFAQQVEKSTVILTWDEFVKITGFDPDKPGQQVVTIPWNEVETLLGVKVEGTVQKGTVDLPWSEFKALLEWSVRNKQDPAGAPPTDYVLTSSEYAGTLSEDVAQLTLNLKLNILRKDGWKRIPVLPGQVAVGKGVKLPEGVFLNSTGDTYELLTQKSGPVEANIPFAAAASSSGGIMQVNFQRMDNTSTVLDLTVSQPDVEVKVAGAQSLVSKPAEDATKVAAALPAGRAVQISWERALPKVDKAPTKLYAETRTLVAVGDAMLLCQELVRYTILHGGVREFKLAVPADVSVLGVSGANVQDWRVDKDGMLQVVLNREAIGNLDLHIAYERAAADGVVAPVIRPRGVERDRGYMGVIALANVEVTAGEVAGVTAIDTRNLPAEIVAMTSQPILLAFRYAVADFNVPLQIRKHEEVGVLVTIVDSAMFTSMQLNDGRRITNVTYAVRNNRRQFLRLAMPEGTEIWNVSVGGRAATPAKDEAGNILLPLVRSAAAAEELASFPVEVVYVETPVAKAPSSGELCVNLPRLDVPVMHVMFSYYLPVEGEYRVPAGLFGSKSGFTGTLRIVDNFTSLATGAGGEVIERNAAGQVEQMQQAFETRADTATAAAGGRPIRVRLPLDGKRFRLEKILALPRDKLYFNVQYRNWQVPE